MKPELEELLEHSGVKGMKWGVRKADKKKGPSKLKTHVDSIKREHSWGKKLRDSDNMSTKELQKVAARAQLENDFKRLSKKSNVGSDKSRKDYLKRADMNDQELLRKVQRLRVKDQLNRNANEITKSQREMAKKIMQVAAPLAIKYALTGRISKTDLIAVALATGGGKVKMVKTAMDEANKVKKQNTKHGEELVDIILHSLQPNELLELLTHGYKDDDVIQHFGVKGMKWGVVRSKIQKAGRAYNKKLNVRRDAKKAKRKAKLDAYHEKNKGKKSYKRLYKHNLKRTKGNHDKAVALTRYKRISDRNHLIAKVGLSATPLMLNTGRKVARSAAKFASNPDNIRKGKNIIQAIKRSPIRYVDGKTMTNVVGTIF